MGIFSRKTYTDYKGYKRYKRSGSLVHRSVASKKLGRSLLCGEVVHHIDRNKRNNSPSNLWVFKSQKAHNRAHKIDSSRYGKSYSFKGSSSRKWWSLW